MNDPSPQPDTPAESSSASTGPRDQQGQQPPAGAGPQRIGNYAIVKKLVEGGMGPVYLAEDAKLGRKAVIKTMRPELAADRACRDQVISAAQTAATIESDYLVPVWSAGEAADGTPFVVMPFMRGETLASRLKRERAPGLGLILKVAREVSRGLAAAHTRGLIHRALCPECIWLEGDLTSPLLGEQIRRCKVLDFGFACPLRKEEIQTSASDAVRSALAYMAPEQALGEPSDARADLYSLGVTLYQMATGDLPFYGPTPAAMLIALTTENPPPVSVLAPALPPLLAALIDHLMSKDPAGRPATAADAFAIVRKVARGMKEKAASARPEGTALESEPPPEGDDIDFTFSAERATHSAAAEPPTVRMRVPQRPAAALPQVAPKRELWKWLARVIGVVAIVPVSWWLISSELEENTEPRTIENGQPKEVKEPDKAVPPKTTPGADQPK